MTFVGANIVMASSDLGGATHTGPTPLTADPLLDVLANNGGPTATMALFAGSPAIDAAVSPCPPTDQRGQPRPQGAACDLGAFEGTVCNPSEPDADGDGIGDACDPCTDTDGDGFGNPGFPANTCPNDSCLNLYNPSQEVDPGPPGNCSVTTATPCVSPADCPISEDCVNLIPGFDPCADKDGVLGLSVARMNNRRASARGNLIPPVVHAVPPILLDNSAATGSPITITVTTDGSAQGYTHTFPLASALCKQKPHHLVCNDMSNVKFSFLNQGTKPAPNYKYRVTIEPCTGCSPTFPLFAGNIDIHVVNGLIDLWGEATLCEPSPANNRRRVCSNPRF